MSPAVPVVHVDGLQLVRRTIERYVPLSDAAWEMVAPCWHERTFGKGSFISEVDRVEQWFSIVLAGVQRLYVEHEGATHCLGFSYPHSWTGDYASFVTQGPGRFQVEAVSDTVLWSIAHVDLHHLYDQVPAMDRFGRLILEEIVQGRATREIELLTLPAEARFRRFMQRSPHLLQLVAQKDIASYLHMTPETFSRLRARVR